jgi:GH18 family chitinase
MKKNKKCFIQDIRRLLHPYNYKIGIDINAHLDEIQYYDLPNINKYADYLYIYAAEYHGNSENVTIPSSPLFSNDPSDDKTVVSPIETCL